MLLSVGMIYGIAINKFQIWPYEDIRDIWNNIEFQQNNIELAYDEKDIGEVVKDEIFVKYKFNNINLVSNNILNNFEVYTQHVEAFNSSKLAYLNFSNNLVTAYNQANPKILGKLIDHKEFEYAEDASRSGGLKTLFTVDDDFIGLVGLFNKDQDCAYGALINITQSIIINRFPCVPDTSEIDFNGLGGGHVWDQDKGLLYIAIGVPTHSSQDIRDLAQNKAMPYGKVLSFSEEQLTKENSQWNIVSSGHRNPQSMTTINGEIYLVEHGPRGGDEINHIVEGKNFGWPNVSIGSHYDGSYISKKDDNDKIYVQPMYSFLPSIGISSINECPITYAKYYKPYECALISSMRAGSLFFVIFDQDRHSVQSIEELHFGSRIRKVQVLNDGMMILGTDNEGIILMSIGLSNY